MSDHVQPHASGGDHDHDHGHFSVFKIFVTLLILTAVEVAWGKMMPYENKLLLWGGLLAMAVWKGALIFMYFMHMKFEGWICKICIVPTAFLVIVVIFALVPDIAKNERMEYGIADQLDPKTGALIELGEGSRNRVNPKYQKDYPDYDPEAENFAGHGDGH